MQLNKLFVKNSEGLELPIRANPSDAGYDVVATSDPIVCGDSIDKDGNLLHFKIQYIEYKTGLFVAPQDAEKYIAVYPRSSISKYNLVLANSVATIDNGYRGEICLRFKYIVQPQDMVSLIRPTSEGGNFIFCARINKDMIYKKGDKIGQIMMKDSQDMHFVKVDALESSDRGEGGFGSSGQ